MDVINSRGLTIGCSGCGALHVFAWGKVLRGGPAPLTLVSLGRSNYIFVNPTILRALWQTGHLYPEQLPAIASDLLVGGTDSRALRELAGFQLPTRGDVEPVMMRVFAELRVPQLDAGDACQIAAREIAIRTLEGRIQPYDASASLAALCSDCGWPEDLTFFVAALDEWDDFPSAREQIAGEILEGCHKLVAAPPPAA